MNGDHGGRLRVTLLGALEVCRGDAVVAVPGARLRGLLARLALAGGRVVDPGVLVEALWPDERPADPANALQSLVSRLRRLLGGSGGGGPARGRLPAGRHRRRRRRVAVRTTGRRRPHATPSR